MLSATEAEDGLKVQPRIVATNGSGVRKRRSATRKTTPQVIATVAFGMLIFGVSTICVMPTIVIGSLYKTDNTTEINMTTQQASWFGSIIFIAQPLGSIVSGFIQDIFGRRCCMMAVNVPQLCGWIILYFAQNVLQLYVAAVIMGLSVGFMEAPAMSYLGEVCDPKLRGTLSSFSETFLMAGILFEFSIGAAFYWRYACAASALVPVVTFILIYLIPESPVWFIVKHRLEDAEKSLMWLRGWVTREEIRQELEELVTNIKPSNQQEYSFVPTSECCARNDIGCKSKKKSEWDQVRLLKEARIRKPIILAASMFFVGHCTSLIGMRPFLVNIFQNFNISLSPYTVLVLTGIMQTLGSVLCVIFIHKLGKRFLVFSSLIICSFGILILTVYTMFNFDYPWMPLTMFCLVFFGAGLGILTLPWVLVCEIFPLEARGISAGLAAASSYVFAFIVTKSYVDLIDLMNMPAVLGLYFVISIMGLYYFYYNLPETEGKSLAEVEELFKTNSLR